MKSLYFNTFPRLVLRVWDCEQWAPSVISTNMISTPVISTNSAYHQRKACFQLVPQILHLFMINSYVLFLLWASEMKVPCWSCPGWPSAAVRERRNFASPHHHLLPQHHSQEKLSECGKVGREGNKPQFLQRRSWSWQSSATWARERDFLGTREGLSHCLL